MGILDNIFKKKGGVELKQPLGFTKQRKFLFFTIKSKPIFSPEGLEIQKQAKVGEANEPQRIQMYIAGIAAKHKDLESALRENGIKQTPYEFIRNIIVNALLITAVTTIIASFFIVTYQLSLIFIPLLAIAMYSFLYNNFIHYPSIKAKNEGKEVERDILFAARDLVIGMRSGMPLFNSMAAVSSGYGAASKEFSKIIELVELGTPMDQALEDVSAKSESKTFKRIMLQASTSIRAGADIVTALQEVVKEVTEERIIELRRYGQRLNALAMFYMLFGVIFPSMGIAVAAILSTFINVVTVDKGTLLSGLVGIFFLQLIFLNLMRSSRPIFAL